MTGTLADTYALLGRSGPIESVLGKAIISLVEPWEGREREYNRWYEDDHVIVSALACPWIFSGKRWVATRALRAQRSTATSAVTGPIDRGCYLAAYWLLDGHYVDFLAWARSFVVHRLVPEGRLSPPRDHVFTNDHDYLGAVYRDATGPRDIHALAYPYRGVGLQIIDTTSASDRPALVEWLANTHVPAVLKGSPAAMALIFATTRPVRPKLGIDWYDRRLTVMWFLEEEPEGCWAAVAADQDRRIAATGLGKVELSAPFLPCLPGTNAYVDQLR